jgi:alcohol dehydrogenase class IV
LSRFESGGGLLAQQDFYWRDGERAILFKEGALAEVVETLRWQGWDRYELLTTERALPDAPLQLPGHAAAVHHVPPGAVNELSAALLDEIDSPALVALGGGRVIDTAKAIAAVRGGRVAALPTTLSGAEMTSIHKIPDGHTVSRRVRPRLVFCDALTMTGLPERELRASAMNALAHGADCLYTSLANPVAELAALRGAKLIAGALDGTLDEPGREELALGSVLCAYAIDSAGFSLHHVICQSLVRVMRTPHAETNAAVLPRALEALIPRAGKQMTALARAIGTKRADLAARVEELAGGRRKLGDVGADASKLELTLDTILDRGELQMTPDPPERDELRDLIEGAW